MPGTADEPSRVTAGGELPGPWTFALSAASAWATPAQAAAEGGWDEAVVPGTVAASLERLGRWHRDRPTPLHDQDAWFRTILTGQGPRCLQFEGLATIAEIWLDDRLVATSDGMFTPVSVPITLDGEHRLTLAFRSLSAELQRRSGARARWRTRMVEEPRLRFVRTTLLGHAPGWCPPIHVVGPYRTIRLVEGAASWRFRTALDGQDGVVTFSTALPEGTEPPRLTCGPASIALTCDPDGSWSGILRLPHVRLWWPHTHGEPHLYPMHLEAGGRRYDLGRTGFRTLALDTGADGRDFTILLNGVRVFCRGVCWTPDLVALGGDRAAYEPTLRQFAAAHVNMIRVGGTMLYESPAFQTLCDELGILVWQDAMLANFDYPRDESFVAAVAGELRGHLRRTQGSPSLAVVCGGSEVMQQAAMMGLPASGYAHPLFDTVLPRVVAEERPDALYTPGSPSGGTLPFTADGGPTHYYGVGAYRRPLEDARRAQVRFASECLAFSNVPDDATLRCAGLDPTHDAERWRAAVPRDNGADWSFEDTRHHYMARLYGIDPEALRDADPRRYRDLSRAVTAEVTERTIDEWRRPGSPTAGALLWFARDFAPGAGWGIVDSSGRPKSNYHALRRAAAPVRLIITDEGVDGLMVHGVNDGAEPVSGTLRLACYCNGSTRVMSGEAAVTLPARGGLSRSAFALFGGFFDAGHAYRFGPPAHDTVWATLTAGDQPIAEAHWLLDHARAQRHDAPPIVTLAEEGGSMALHITATRALVAVVIDDIALVPEDNGFFLMAGQSRLIPLTPLPGFAAMAPTGEVRALNLVGGVRYG